MENTIHQFWYQMDQEVDSTIVLCPLRILSVKSFLANGYCVVFWSYQPISNQIEGVEYRDAREIISEKDFLSKNVTLHRPLMGEVMKGRVNIAHFSDWFRALLLYKQGGWWFDTDAYCLARLPKLRKKDQGVILCSLPIKKKGARIVRREGSDFSNSTIYAVKGHPLMKEMAKRVKATFGKPLSQGFVEPMYQCYNAVKEGGYLDSIRPPIIFIPLCWWRTRFYYHQHDKERKRLSFGEYVPTAETILKKSSAVNFYNGTFQYLLEQKENSAHTLFEHICKMCGEEIDLDSIFFDGSNYHISGRPEKKRKVDAL